MIPLLTHTWASSPHTSLPWFLQTDMENHMEMVADWNCTLCCGQDAPTPRQVHSVSHGGGWLVAVPTASAAQPLVWCWGSLLLPGPAEGRAALR